MGIIFWAVMGTNGSYKTPCGDRSSLLPRDDRTEFPFNRTGSFIGLLIIWHSKFPIAMLQSSGQLLRALRLEDQLTLRAKV